MTDLRQAAVGRSTTAEGFSFDPAEDVWRLGADSGSAVLDFNLPAASGALRASIKAVTLVWVRSRPTIASRGDLKQLRYLLRRIATTAPNATVHEITAAHVREYAHQLPHNRKYRASELKYALERWAKTGIGGLADCLLNELPHMRWGWPPSGQAVRACSPTEGALSADQRDDLCEALREVWLTRPAYAASACAAMLVVRLGRRPYQVACLKTSDLIPPSDPADFAADLLVPRAKQGTGILARSEFTRVGLKEELAEMFRAQRSAAMAWASQWGIEPLEAPMFPVATRPGAPLPRRVPGMAGHLSSSDLSRRISLLIRRIDGVPGRAEGELVGPMRLRRTLASVLADEGWSLESIADVLDQTSAGSALIYAQATAALADRLDRALGGMFAALASGFDGDGDPSAILRDIEDEQDDA